MPRLSVIIPVYNVESYIGRCINSLFEQTLSGIEYIFIDDCTPDNSMGIVHKYIKEYQSLISSKGNSVRTYKMPANSGQAAVRRQGIKLATGEYIIHCDSDDWIDPNLYYEMYTKAVEDNADIVICPIRDEYKNVGITRPIVNYQTSCRDILKNWYKQPIGMFSWNKIVKRSLYIENDLLPFEGINMWEDNGMFLRVFYYADKLSYTTNSVYHYNQSNTSATTNGYGRNAINQMIKCAQKLDIFFTSKPDYKDFEKTNNAIKFLAKLNLVTNHFSWLKEFYQLFPESNCAINFIPRSAFSKKGYTRFLFVKFKLAWLFVTLFKIKIMVSKIITAESK